MTINSFLRVRSLEGKGMGDKQYNNLFKIKKKPIKNN